MRLVKWYESTVTLFVVAAAFIITIIIAIPPLVDNSVFSGIKEIRSDHSNQQMELGFPIHNRLPIPIVGCRVIRLDQQSQGVDNGTCPFIVWPYQTFIITVNVNIDSTVNHTAVYKVASFTGWMAANSDAVTFNYSRKK